MALSLFYTNTNAYLVGKVTENITEYFIVISTVNRLFIFTIVIFLFFILQLAIFDTFLKAENCVFIRPNVTFFSIISSCHLIILRRMVCFFLVLKMKLAITAFMDEVL